MPTTIDSLVVSLSLDASSFTKEQQAAMDQLRKFEEETRRSGARIEDHEKRTVSFFSSLKREAIAFAGIAIGGAAAKQFFDYVTNLDAGIGRLSKTMNMSARDLSAWQGAVKRIGGSPEAISATLSAISTDVMRTQQVGGVANIQQILGSLGGGGFSIFGQNGRLKTADQMLLDAAEALDKSGLNPGERATRLGMIQGMNQDTLNLLMKSRPEIEKMLGEERKNAPSPDDIARAEKYQDTWAKLTNSATNLGRQLVTVIGPAMTKFLDKLAETMTPEGNKRSQDYQEDLAQKGPIRRFINRWWGKDTPPSDGKTPSGSNMPKFLGALSFLETDQRDIGNAKTSAKGYFQFTDATAKDAIASGIGDPRTGTFEEQSRKAEAFIRKFHPTAAAAIERGDWATAERILAPGRWPSLPGGSQPQNPARYLAYRAQLNGGGGGVNVTNNVSVTTPTTDPHTHGKIVGDEVTKQINRSQLAINASGGSH